MSRETNPPELKSSPRDFCALITLSVSSSNVGTNRIAIVIIIASSCAGTPIFFSGDKSFSVASVNFSGEVVKVNKLDKIIIKINRKLINAP